MWGWGLSHLYFKLKTKSPFTLWDILQRRYYISLRVSRDSDALAEKEEQKKARAEAEAAGGSGKGGKGGKKK